MGEWSEWRGITISQMGRRDTFNIYFGCKKIISLSVENELDWRLYLNTTRANSHPHYDRFKSRLLHLFPIQTVLKMGHFRPLLLNFVFSIQLLVKIADDWIRTADLWCWKRPLYQLSHNKTKYRISYITDTHFTIIYRFVHLQPNVD